MFLTNCWPDPSRTDFLARGVVARLALRNHTSRMLDNFGPIVFSVALLRLWHLTNRFGPLFILSNHEVLIARFINLTDFLCNVFQFCTCLIVIFRGNLLYFPRENKQLDVLAVLVRNRLLRSLTTPKLSHQIAFGQCYLDNIPPWRWTANLSLKNSSSNFLTSICK